MQQKRATTRKYSFFNLYRRAAEREINMDLKGKKINFLGDSITEGHGTSGKDKIFLNLLKEREGLKEARNYGIGGTRIANQMGEDDMAPSYCQRFCEMDDDADIIVVFGGTNDYGHGNAPLGTFASITPDTFYGACRYLIEGLMEKYPTSLIVFMAPLHRKDDASPSMGNREPLETYVKIIREVCEYYSIPLLDLYKTLGICPNVEISRVTYCPDGLHPNDAGHELIYSRLAGFVKSL